VLYELPNKIIIIRKTPDLIVKVRVLRVIAVKPTC